MRKPLVCASLLIPLFVAGCMQTGRIVGGTSRPHAYVAGVSLSPGTTEIVRFRAYRMRLVGRTQSCNYPIDVRSVRVVMNGVKPNYELIASLQPNIVVYDLDLFAHQDIDKFKELGIETFGVGGDTIDQFIDSLYRLGAKIGNEREISEYADQIFAAREAAKGSPVTPTPKIAVMIPGKGGEHMIAGLKSFQADVVRAASGLPVGPDARMFVSANVENLVLIDPEVILSAGDPSPIVGDPRLQSLKAVKAGHVIQVSADAILRRGTRIADLIRGLNDGLHKKLDKNQSSAVNGR